jgi:glycosyltransferase involved in cell wall biosynthesis
VSGVLGGNNSERRAQDKTEVIFIANGNGLSDKSSGSLVRTFNVFNQLAASGLKVLLATTSGGLNCARKYIDQAIGYFLYPASLRGGRQEKNNLTRLWSYLVTIVSSPWVTRRLPPARFVITDSDYPCDFIPAFLYTQRHRDAIWVANIYHEIQVLENKRLLTLVTRLAQQACWRFITAFADHIQLLNSHEGQKLVHILHTKYKFSGTIHLVDGGTDRRLIQDTPRGRIPGVEVVSVGYLRPNKGFKEIVDIWQEVVRVRPQSRLHLIGGIANLPLFKRHLAQADLEGSVTLTGFVDTQTLYDYLRSAKLFITPSLSEGFGISVCEALTAGLPVVAFELDTLRSVFGDSFWGVPVGDTGSFAKTVVSLLNGELTTQAKVEKGLQVTEKFDWVAVGRQQYDIFCKVAGFDPPTTDRL